MLAFTMLNVLISGFSKEGMINQEMELLHEMQQIGLTPSTSTCNILTSAYYKYCNNIKVTRLVKEIVEKGFMVIDSAFQSLINLFSLARERGCPKGFLKNILKTVSFPAH